MPEIIKINGYEVHRGQSSIIKLNTYRLPTRTDIEIPVSVYRSANKGPVVLLIAGMHGDEINGIEIIRRLIVKNHFNNLLCGTIIAIPVINIISFIYGTRSLPDGRDLNRCFPGSLNGSLGSRIAHDLMREVIPQIDIGLDFHTGGASRSNYPQVRCIVENFVNMELAHHFGAPFILNSAFRDKSLRKEAARIKKTILVYEGGESLRFDEFAIQEGFDGCLRLLNKLGMINTPVSERQSRVIDKTTWVRAQSAGMFHPLKKLGNLVRKNEVIGAISDPYGEFEVKIKSPSNGYIIGQNNLPTTNRGDALIHIGIENNIFSGIDLG